MTKKWIGSNECDYCGRKPVDVRNTAYDAQTKYGPWAFMCRPCYYKHGREIGQEYDAKTLVKIRNLGGNND